MVIDDDNNLHTEDTGMNHEPNTTRWQIGDIVIHDADAKRREMLMRVIGYDPKTGLCKTRYVYPGSFRPHFPRKKVYRNEISVLHDPARFGIEVPQDATN